MFKNHQTKIHEITILKDSKRFDLAAQKAQTLSAKGGD